MKTILAPMAALLLLASCESQPKAPVAASDSSSQGIRISGDNPETFSTFIRIREDDLHYQAGNTACSSLAVYDPTKKSRLPIVLIIPEWWGLNDYPIMRAEELSREGYLAIAVDLYGGRAVATTPDEAKALAGPLYTDTALVRARLQAALDAARALPNADGSRVAIIGYCFGGHMALMGAKLGLPIRGAASFHGGLAGTANANAPILICHGGADKNIPEAEVAAWRKSMDSLKGSYKFISYRGATHAFTNPKATETGKQFGMPIEYNEAADKASWAELLAFLKRVM